MIITKKTRIESIVAELDIVDIGEILTAHVRNNPGKFGLTPEDSFNVETWDEILETSATGGTVLSGLKLHIMDIN